MNPDIACIAVDWGTSNRRAWALDRHGRVTGASQDGQGLLAVTDRDFAGSLHRFAGDWLRAHPPVIMAGMIGSRTGWQEAPYLETPAALTSLASHLIAVDQPDGSLIRIVPGIARQSDDEADVMRGEECQLLGAMLAQGRQDGIFLLPGTHAKWVRVENGAVTDFRTYMTGELFASLRKGGSLSHVMLPDGAADVFDREAFERGLVRALAPDAAALPHLLFGVRSLSLFGKLHPAQAPSYLSGLLIGTEMKDALRWLGPLDKITAIGSAHLLESYARAAACCDIALDPLESDVILPQALFAIARDAGLLEMHP